MRRHILNIVFGVAAAGLFGSEASAQQPPAPAPSAGSLVVEQIVSGWLFAPDARATDLDGRTGALAGGYIGRITDRSLVIGAGAYFLTNREDDFKLAYGGPVFEWLVGADRKIGFGVRALTGFGAATLPRPISDFVDPRMLASGGGSHRAARSAIRQFDPAATVAIDESFFVAEPQVNVMWNIAAGQRLMFGVGYRAVANAPLLGDQLNGVSGSVSFQIGGK